MGERQQNFANRSLSRLHSFIEKRARRSAVSIERERKRVPNNAICQSLFNYCIKITRSRGELIRDSPLSAGRTFRNDKLCTHFAAINKFTENLRCHICISLHFSPSKIARYRFREGSRSNEIIDTRLFFFSQNIPGENFTKSRRHELLSLA